VTDARSFAAFGNPQNPISVISLEGIPIDAGEFFNFRRPGDTQHFTRPLEQIVCSKLSVGILKPLTQFSAFVRAAVRSPTNRQNRNPANF
jgi:hypothetical protein